MFDAMIASALKRLLDEHVHFRKRVSVEEQRAPKYGRFFRGRQFVYMKNEHFRATGAHQAVQGLADFFNIRSQNDDIQDFDVRWDQALVSASDTLSDMILDGLYTSKKMLISFRPSWFCTIQKLFETKDRQVIYD